MRRYPKVFSRLQIALSTRERVAACWTSMVERIASYLEYEMKVRALIAKALIYPVMILILALLAWVCVPHLFVLVNDGFAPFLALIWPPLRIWIAVAIGLIVASSSYFSSTRRG